MKDYIIKGMAANNEIRFVAAYSRSAVQKAREIHNTSTVYNSSEEEIKDVIDAGADIVMLPFFKTKA